MTYDQLASFIMIIAAVMIIGLGLAFLFAPRKTKDVLLDIAEFLALFFVFWN